MRFIYFSHSADTSPVMGRPRDQLKFLISFFVFTALALLEPVVDRQGVRADPPEAAVEITGAQRVRRSTRNGADLFAEQVKVHRQRVVELALAVRRQFFDQYGMIEPELIKDYLAIHDLPKTTPAFAKRFGEFWGKNPESLEPGPASRLKETIQDLNQTEKELKVAFWKKRASTDPLIVQRLGMLELVADFVDRGIDPVAEIEFGRPMKLASESMREVELRHQAAWAEMRYESIVTPRGRPRVSKSARLHHWEDSCLKTGLRLAAEAAGGM